jgi:OFA family oxalate/formate antiporter-like MFS transporter
MVIHLIPFLEDNGLSKALAAVALGSLAMTSVIGRLGFGWLGDRFDRKRMVLFALTVMGFSMFILASATQMWHIAVFFILYAPAYGGLAAMMHALRGDYFGRTSFATISGFMATIMAVGTIIGPIFAGYVFDVTGSYRLAFITFGIATFVALILIVVTKQPTEQDLV